MDSDMTFSVHIANTVAGATVCWLGTKNFLEKKQHGEANNLEANVSSEA